MSSRLFAAIVLLSTYLTAAAAHGSLNRVSIDGKVYAGPLPNGMKGVASPIRQISHVEPVMPASSPNMACGNGVVGPAPVVAPANPGSKMSFQWVNGNGGLWPHNMGPILTYLAACEGTTCDKFDETKAKWFKIDELAMKPEGGWYQAGVKAGDAVTVTLPKDLAPGDYLVRHELINLALATSPNEAEMFPSCTQIRVGGSGTAKPDASELVSFPGAYKDSDAGLFVAGLYNPGFKYTIPGPPLAKMAVVGGGSITSAPLPNARRAFAFAREQN